MAAGRFDAVGMVIPAGTFEEYGDATPDMGLTP
jgi:hypothetical protein